MIYDTKSPYFQSFLTTSKHTPTTDEIVEALNDLKRKSPSLKPEELATGLRQKYPMWVLDDVNWAELAEKVDD